MRTVSLVSDRNVHRAEASPSRTRPDPNNTDFNQAPVGTGAFKWGRRVAGDRLELVANDGLLSVKGPYLEQLVFKYIPDNTVLYTQFKSGDIDLVGQALHFS